MPRLDASMFAAIVGWTLYGLIYPQFLIYITVENDGSVQTFADKSKQEALKNDLVEALKRKQQS